MKNIDLSSKNTETILQSLQGWKCHPNKILESIKGQEDQACSSLCVTEAHAHPPPGLCGRVLKLMVMII